MERKSEVVGITTFALFLVMLSAILVPSILVCMAQGADSPFDAVDVVLLSILLASLGSVCWYRFIKRKAEFLTHGQQSVAIIVSMVVSSGILYLLMPSVI